MLRKILNRIISQEMAIVVGCIFLGILEAYSLEISTAYGIYGKILLSLITSITILFIAFRVVDHSHILAQLFGEPEGSLILTLSIVTIEITMIISGLRASGDLEVLKNTAFAVLMLSTNGIGGLSLLIGGLKYNRQPFNTKGISAYLALIIFTSSICFILPSYSVNDAIRGVLTIPQVLFVCSVMLTLYTMFLIKQTMTHKDYFLDDMQIEEAKISPRQFSAYHNLCLFIGLLTIIKLSKFLLHDLQDISAFFSWPAKIPGIIVGILVLAPEGLSAIKAAGRNDLQKALNICLGSAVASLSVTVPCVLFYSYIVLQKNLIMAITDKEIALLYITFSIILATFNSKKTNSLCGTIMLGSLMSYFIF